MNHSRKSHGQPRRLALRGAATSRRDPTADIVALLVQCDWEPCSSSFTLRRRGVDELDFIVAEYDSIFVFYPRSAAAKDWWRDHVAQHTLHCGRNFVVEHRFVHDILMGLRRDDFVSASGGGEDA